MHIYVDADACPVVGIVERLARERGLPVTLLCDTNHVLQSDYAAVRVVGAGKDAVDFALVNLLARGDLVVTQDYGLAAMALGRGADALHQSGLRYTARNIDALLLSRHLAGKARRAGMRTKGPRRRTVEDDKRFAEALRQLLDGEDA